MVDKIKLENVNTGQPIEKIIADHNFVLPEELAKAQAEVYQIPYVDLKKLVFLRKRLIFFLIRSLSALFVFLTLWVKKKKNSSWPWKTLLI